MQILRMDIEEILSIASKNPNISDIHLSSNEFVAYRVNGEVSRKEDIGQVGDEQMEIILRQLFRNNPQRFDKFLADKESDFAFIAKDETPFRINAFFKTGKLGIVLRKINSEPRILEEIMFQNTADSIKQNILASQKGLFLVTGPTGAGKSTSIVSMLEEINKNKPYNIVTIEDPIEYVFQAKKSIISQRELGHDTWSFQNAIKASLREDPDVIMVGEIRSQEGADAVMNLAETGHLVFSTLHTSSAVQSINRLLSYFPSDMQQGILNRLSDSLSGILSQSLVKRKDGQGRLATFELLLNNTAVRNNLKKQALDQIGTIIETNSQSGMISMRQYTKKLLERGIIDQSEADKLEKNRIF
ncbi:twitching motility protein PilT [candidate division SR1 bacterium]|nr:twitching motility protein PilT [candidate division SR1 bacterium]